MSNDKDILDVYEEVVDDKTGDEAVQAIKQSDRIEISEDAEDFIRDIGDDT